MIYVLIPRKDVRIGEKNMKLLCSECGQNDVLAKGLCRLCYDKKRIVPRIVISKTIQNDVTSLKESKAWTLNKTCNHLMRLGLMFIKQQNKMKEMYEL